MKKYTASEELAQILLKNGFSEITSAKFPEHQKNIEENGYEPLKAKRAFSINTKDLVIFEYTMIKASPKGGCIGINMSEEFTADQIRSIIAFFNMPFQTRNAYSRQGSAIPSLHEEYSYMKQNPGYKRERRHIIMDSYESAKL